MNRLPAIAILALATVAAGLGALLLGGEWASSAPGAQPPMPVQERNLDADGNIKVHEQGTADVRITNTTLPVTPRPTAIDGGGGRIGATCPGETVASTPITASALQIERSANGGDVQLMLGNSRIANFFGLSNDERQVVLALTRPIRFDRVSCSGIGAVVIVNWVGNEP